MSRVMDYLVALMVYVGLLALVGGDFNQVDPDFIAYYQNAVHWSHGSLDRAISGYWGPLFSLLMAPFLSLGLEPTVLVCFTVYSIGGLFVLSSVLFFATAQLPRKYQVIGGIGTAAFAVIFATPMISPDFLLSAFILLGYSALLAALRGDSIPTAMLAGLLFGLAYLSKAAGIVIGVGIILGIPILLYLLNELKFRSAVRIGLPALLGLLMVAIPWVVALSAHYGEFTWSTAASRSQLLASGTRHQNFTVFHVPRDGRITSWEDPTEIEYAEKANSAQAQHQSPDTASLALGFRVISINTKKIAKIFVGSLWFAVSIGGLLALLLHAGPIPRFLDAPWRLGFIGGAIIVMTYALSYAGPQRYFIACFPLFLASTLGLVAWAERGGLFDWSVVRSAPRLSMRIPILLVFVALIFTPVMKELEWKRSKTASPTAYTVARMLARELEQDRLSGPVADIGNHRLGLFTAFHLGMPYFGAEMDASNIDFLRQSGARVLIVDATVTPELQQFPYISDISAALSDRIPALRESDIKVFRFDAL